MARTTPVQYKQDVNHPSSVHLGWDKVLQVWLGSLSLAERVWLRETRGHCRPKRHFSE